MLALFAVMTLAATLSYGYFFERKRKQIDTPNTDNQEQSLPMLHVETSEENKPQI